LQRGQTITGPPEQRDLSPASRRALAEAPLARLADLARLPGLAAPRARPLGEELVPAEEARLLPGLLLVAASHSGTIDAPGPVA
jgi:hypothetical protein